MNRHDFKLFQSFYTPLSFSSLFGWNTYYDTRKLMHTRKALA